MTLFPAVVQELKRRKATDIVVFGGGIIPDDDIATLKKQGVAEIFTPGTPLQEIVTWLRKRFPEGAASSR
jgi:methylmalonyl-CoA mutase C-terminal domain/subunit